MPSDVEVQQLIIYVGTQAQIEAEKAEGHITDDDFVVVTDAPALQPLLTAQNAGTGIAITTEGGIVKISNTQTSAIWGNIEGDIANQYDLQQALATLQNNIDGKVAPSDLVAVTNGEIDAMFVEGS